MSTSRKIFRLLVVAACCAVPSWGQAAPRGPHIGYVYPAGAQRGTSVRVTVGGQNLSGNSEPYICGAGVHATFVQFVRPLTQKQLQSLRVRLAQLRDKRLAGAGKRKEGSAPNPPAINPKRSDDLVPLPDHPLLQNLEMKSNAELRRIADEFLSKKKQPNTQIAETVILDIAIDANAALGGCELRLRTPAGLTNPLRFVVGALPEAREQEPNDPGAMGGPDMAQALPAVFNGQIAPGDVDRFRFGAKKGQHLVIATQARALAPFMADAVPGWFQPLVTLYDTNGREALTYDDNEFDPDPVFAYDVPIDGEYVVGIADALYRGREDFVYRIVVGELPLVTSIYPLGGHVGEPVPVTAVGWNLATPRIELERQGAPGVYVWPQTFGPPIRYAVDNVPECAESEPNDAPASAQRCNLPCIMNGRIGAPGDTDEFQFEGETGKVVVVAVTARVLSSPLDALVRVTDATGAVVAMNDDNPGANVGEIVQHADGYVRVPLPRAGVYNVRITDAQRRGGDAFGYRLRIGPPQPDFDLYVAPSGVTVPAGRSAQIAVHVVRKNGFDGAIELRLANAPAGITLDAPFIPKDKDCIQTTLSATPNAGGALAPVTIAGTALVAGNPVEHAAVPAEDLMQAFIYRHLVPTREFLVAVQRGKAKNAVVRLADTGTVHIPLGGTATVRVLVPGAPLLDGVTLELSEAPKGIAISNVAFEPGGAAIQLAAADGAAKVGASDNLIVAAFRVPEAAAPGGKPVQKRRQSLGVLPAIPIQVVAK